jgi:hypothetical protein
MKKRFSSPISATARAARKWRLETARVDDRTKGSANALRDPIGTPSLIGECGPIPTAGSGRVLLQPDRALGAA